jgi:hypothetical protein
LFFQGIIQGALWGLKAIGEGIGPLCSSSVFGAFTNGSFNFPQAPFIMCGVLAVVALLIGISIPRAALATGKHGKEILEEEAAFKAQSQTNSSNASNDPNVVIIDSQAANDAPYRSFSSFSADHPDSIQTQSSASTSSPTLSSTTSTTTATTASDSFSSINQPLLEHK